ncbi:hypothetical protein LguiA_001967 [Lonicera macranthoides]
MRPSIICIQFGSVLPVGDLDTVNKLEGSVPHLKIKKKCQSDLIIQASGGRSQALDLISQADGARAQALDLTHPKSVMPDYEVTNLKSLVKDLRSQHRSDNPGGETWGGSLRHQYSQQEGTGRSSPTLERICETEPSSSSDSQKRRGTGILKEHIVSRVEVIKQVRVHLRVFSDAPTELVVVVY